MGICSTRDYLRNMMQEVPLLLFKILLVKTMEVDERPSEDYTDIGGLEK
jgi:ATP-dependent 26S proteasome regulatory subunit